MMTMILLQVKKMQELITRWSLQKQNSLSGKQVTNKSIQTDSLQYSKDNFKLYGLDSAITSVNFYGNNSKIIAASNNEISIWNLNADKRFPLKINQVIATHLIPKFTLEERIKWSLVYRTGFACFNKLPPDI